MSLRRGAIAGLAMMALAVTAAPRDVFAQSPSAGPAAPSGGDPAAQKEWTSVLGMLSQSMSDLNDADRGLATFVTGTKLTPKGKSATTALTSRLDAARTNLQSTIDAAKLLAARPQTTAADAARFRDANLAAVTEAGNATQAAKAAVQEPSYVDHSDEERAAAARKAADAAAARDAAAAAAEQARKDADAKRKADEAQKRSDADAKVRADVDAKSAAVAQALKDQGDRAKQIDVALSAFLLRNNLTSDARNAGIKMQRRLDANSQGRMAAQGRLTALKAKLPAQSAALVATLLADVSALGRELSTMTDEQKTIATSSRSYIGGIVPPQTPTNGSDAPAAPVSTSVDIVPTCDFTFEPADGKPMMLAIDGGPSRPLPTHAHLASGRHTLVIRRDPDSVERHELLLCGYVSTVPLEPIK